MAVDRARRPDQQTPGRDLIHHGLVSTVLGFPLSILLSGLAYHLSGGDADPAKYQVVMWIVAPIWVTIIGLSFLAPSRRACWLWLVGASLLAWLVLDRVIR